ncbi:MAG: CsgG/HfaB family protein [Tannerella sp.]|jgi:hypothetical protein|nr:CsgG/HfaB family protein [Tannerella sp.]
MKILITSILTLCCFLAAGQEERKVAVFDPAGSIDKTLLEIVREEISSAVVNTQGYTVLERQLINKVMEENKFQASGLVSDAQVSDVGKLMGADYVVVSTVSGLGANYHISCKMIEVATARINRQYTGMTKNGLGDLTAVVRSVVNSMFEQDKTEPPSRQPEKPSNTLPEDLSKTFLQTRSAGVYANGIKLSTKQTRSLMSNTPSWTLYNSGKSKRNTGNILMYSGIAVAAGCLVGGFLLTHIETTREGDDIIEREYTYLKEGLIGAAVAGGVAILGISMKVSGKKEIQRAVDMYNNKKIPVPENSLKFEVKPNGVGLVYNF